MTKTLNKEIDITVGPKPIVLSYKNAIRYEKMAKDFEKGKNTKSFNNIDDLINDLNA